MSAKIKPCLPLKRMLEGLSRILLKLLSWCNFRHFSVQTAQLFSQLLLNLPSFSMLVDFGWAGPSSDLWPWGCLLKKFDKEVSKISWSEKITRQIFNFPKHVCPLSGYHMPLYILILGCPGHWDIDYSRLVWKKNGFVILNSRMDRCATRGQAVKLLNTTVHFVPVVFPWHCVSYRLPLKVQ